MTLLSGWVYSSAPQATTEPTAQVCNVHTSKNETHNQHKLQTLASNAIKINTMTSVDRNNQNAQWSKMPYPIGPAGSTTQPETTRAVVGSNNINLGRTNTLSAVSSDMMRGLLLNDKSRRKKTTGSSSIEGPNISGVAGSQRIANFSKGSSSKSTLPKIRSAPVVNTTARLDHGIPNKMGTIKKKRVKEDPPSSMATVPAHKAAEHKRKNVSMAANYVPNLQPFSAPFGHSIQQDAHVGSSATARRGSAAAYSQTSHSDKLTKTSPRRTRKDPDGLSASCHNPPTVPLPPMNTPYTEFDRNSSFVPHRRLKIVKKKRSIDADPTATGIKQIVGVATSSSYPTLHGGATIQKEPARRVARPGDSLPVSCHIPQSPPAWVADGEPKPSSLTSSLTSSSGDTSLPSSSGDTTSFVPHRRMKIKKRVSTGSGSAPNKTTPLRSSSSEPTLFETIKISKKTPKGSCSKSSNISIRNQPPSSTASPGGRRAMPNTQNNNIQRATSIMHSSSVDSLHSKSVKSASSSGRPTATGSDGHSTAATARPIIRSSSNDALRRKVKCKASTIVGDDHSVMSHQSHLTVPSVMWAPSKVKSKAWMSGGNDHSVMSHQSHQTAPAPRTIPRPISRSSSIEAPRRRRKSATDPKGDGNDDRSVMSYQSCSTARTTVTNRFMPRSSSSESVKTKFKKSGLTSVGGCYDDHSVMSHQTTPTTPRIGRSTSSDALKRKVMRVGQVCDDDISVISHKSYIFGTPPTGTMPIIRSSSSDAVRQRVNAAARGTQMRNPILPSSGSGKSLEPVAPRRTFKRSSFDLPDPLLTRFATQPAEKVCKAAAAAATALRAST
jgi:hypothetical protein